MLVDPPVEPQEERISRQAPETEERPAATKRGGEEVGGPGSPKRTALNPTTGTKRAAETSLDILDPRSPGHPDDPEEQHEGQVLLIEAGGHVDEDPIELPEDSLEHLAEDDGQGFHDHPDSWDDDRWELESRLGKVKRK